MKALFYIGIVVVTLAYASVAQARMGETIAQCEARYGKPVYDYAEFMPGFKLGIFKKNGINIQITFWQGKAGMVNFSKDEGKGDLSSDEVQNLLEANSGGSSWSAPNVVNPTKTEWTRADGITARLNSQEADLKIMDPVFSSAFEAARSKAKPKSATDGF